MSRPATAARCGTCGALLTLGRCPWCRRVAALGRATLWAHQHPTAAAWVGAWRIAGWRLWQVPGWVRRLRQMATYLD